MRPIAARVLFATLAMGVAFAAMPGDSVAGEYPSKPITVIVPYNPGGATDTQTRIIAEYLSTGLGQPIVVENRPGGSGVLGMGQLARSAPDGYTMAFSDASPLALAPHLFRKLPFDVEKDFTPIILNTFADLALVVHPSFKANTVKDLIKLLKGDPGRYNYASFGQGSISHLAAELFMLKTDTKMIHVPYTGSTAAFVDLLPGRVPIMFSIMPPTVGHIKGGTLRALGVTGPKRTAAVPDVPTVAEAGVAGYEAPSWFVFAFPAKTPKEIVERMNAEINKVLKLPEVKEKFANLGLTLAGGSVDRVAKYVIAERKKWGKVVKEAGLKPLD